MLLAETTNMQLLSSTFCQLLECWVYWAYWNVIGAFLFLVFENIYWLYLEMSGAHHTNLVPLFQITAIYTRSLIVY